MRVLEVTEASGSGTLGIVQTLAEGLSSAGHEVAVAFGRRPETPSDLASELPDAVEVVALPWARRSPSQQLAAGRALRRLTRDWRPDVVHLHSSFAGAVGSIALHGHAPLVYTPHGYAFGRSDPRLRRAAYWAVEWMVARRCAMVGAVSEAEAALARKWLRAPRVTVVPNGISELDPGAQAATPPRTRTEVVAMGRIDPERRPAGATRILAAVAAATDARVTWIGAAKGGEHEPLEAAGVAVTGWLSRRDAVERLSTATVYLHWSASDGLSLAVLEALAHDVVVVASDIPANREIVGPGQVCRDEAEAIELVLAILADEALRDALLSEQRTRRARWGARRMVDGWTAVYRELVAAGTPHAGTPIRPGASVIPRNIWTPWN